MKRFIAVSLQLMFLGMLIFLTSENTHAQTVRYVASTGDDSSNNCTDAGSPCATIQAAVSASSDGDSIYVSSGTYEPFRTSFGGPAKLIIQGVNGAEIELGAPVSPRRIVDLRADSTTFRGFTIDGSTNGSNHVGISVSGRGVTVSGNTITGVLTGIQTNTQYTIGGNTITGNAISNSGYGISLQNNSNTVTGNTIDVDTEGFGIGSQGDTITGNDLTIGDDGHHLQGYAGNEVNDLPGAVIDLDAFLENNDFDKAVYVKQDGNFSSQTIFGSIDAALDSASTGDSVFVLAGTYGPFATSSSGQESLTIIGSEGATVIREETTPLQRVIDLRAGGTTLRGFTVKGNGTHVGISITGQGTTIEDNTIDSVLTAIQTTTQNEEGNNTITGNTITNSDYGISLQNNTNVITNNEINVDVIGLAVGSGNNTITGNDLTVATGGRQVTTSTKEDYEALPGADIDLLETLEDNDFDRAVYVKNNSDALSVQTIFGNIQAAIDSASADDIIYIRPGTYNESATYNSDDLGLVINKSVSLIGVTDADAEITNYNSVQATIVSGDESGWGTNFYITGTDVTIQGLELQAVAGSVDPESPSNAVNKAIEVTSDGFTLEHSVISAATGYTFDGNTSTSVYFGDEDPDDLDNFTVNNNRLHGGITITNGAGDGAGPVSFVITNNVVTGSHFLRVRGDVDDVAWLNAHALLPTTVTGNDISGVSSFILQNWDEDTSWLADTDYLNSLIANNTLGNYAWTVQSDGDLRFIQYEEYGGTAPAFFLQKTIQSAADSAQIGDTVRVSTGTFSEELTLSQPGFILQADENTILSVGRDETGITISGDSVSVLDFEISGPYTNDFNTVDWDTMANAFGITINGSASKAVISGNEINDIRTGISFLSGSSGTASNNVIDNTKGSFLIRTDNATLTGNSYGATGNEWDIVLFSVSDGAYVTSPTVDEEAYGTGIMALSSANGNMTVLDRRYGLNGFLGLAANAGNRSHVYAEAGTSFDADDDFGVGNGLGNINQPLATLQDGVDALVSGGVMTVRDGTYSNVTIDKSLSMFSVNGSGAVTIQGPGTSQQAAIRVAENVEGVTIGSAGLGFTIEAQAPDLAALYLAEGASDITVTGNVLNGGTRNAFLTTGSVSDITVSGNALNGNGPRAIAYVNGETSLGASRATDNVDFINNTFTGSSNAGLLLGIESTNATVSGNTFNGTGSYGQLEVWESGATISGNSFLADGDGYVFVDAGSNYNEAGILASNAKGATVRGKDNIYNSIQAAFDAAEARDSILVDGGSYSDEKIIIDTDSLTLELSAGADGLDSLSFDASILKFTLAGNDSAMVITGNNLDNEIGISGANNSVDAGGGTDTIILNGQRYDYGITENSGRFNMADNRSGSPNGTVSIDNFEFARFDNITISLTFSIPVSYPGGSLSFSNDTATVEIQNQNVYNLSDSLSVEIWIKVAGFTSSGQTILAKGSDAWSIHRDGTTNNLAFTTYSSSVQHTLEGNTPVNDDEWHHVAAVFDGSTKYLYVDGVLDTSEAAGTIDTNTDPVTLGGWTGITDELRIWNRIRSADQIRGNLFQQLMGDETGLEGYWRMDEGSGSSLGDLTSNENDASLSATTGIAWSSDTHPAGTFLTGNAGWRIIGSPAGAATYSELLESLWTQGFPGADDETGDPTVFVYVEGDGATDASGRGFQVLSSMSGTPSSGQAFLIYTFEDDDPTTDGIQGGFPKMLRTDESQNASDVTINLSITRSGTGGTYDAVNDGWNMVGNPYAATIDWDTDQGWTRAGIDESIYVWSDSANGGTGAYLSWNGLSGTLGSGKVAAMQGFWVKANNTGTPSIVIDDTARSSGGVLFKKAAVPELQFTLRGNGLSNRTIVMFADGAETGKDRYDAFKLASNNPDWLSVSTSLTGQESLMDILSLPLELEEPVELSLNTDGSNMNGEFELSWLPKAIDSEWHIRLIDNKNGEILDLSERGNYSFELQSSAKSVKETIGSPESMVLMPRALRSKSSVEPGRFTILISKGQTVSNEPDLFIPEDFELEQNYPNPFNPSTIIRYGVPEQSQVTLEIFDITGRKVVSLINNENKAPGRYSVQFDAGDLASGLYVYRLVMTGKVITKKMILLK